MLKIFVLFLLFFSQFFSYSFCAFAKDYKIEELLEIAESNSSNIKSAQYLAESQKHLANQQKYWDNPTFDYKENSGNGNFSVSQSIPFYNKLKNRYDIEEARYQAYEARKNNTILFVKAEVFRLLYQYQAIKKRIELTQKRLDRLSLVNQYLTTIVLTSPTKRAQSFITKDKIRLIERDLIKYKNELYQIWNAVNVFLNLEQEPSNLTLDWLSQTNYRGKKFFVNIAIDNNLDLIEQKSLIDKSRSELSYAKIEQMPDVNISASRESNSNSNNLNSNRSSTGVGVSLSVPLLNRNQEKIIGANSNLKAQQALYEFQRNQLVKLLNNNINEYETLLKLAENFPISDVNQIVSRLSRANTDFKKGVLDFITYIELDSQEYQIIDTIIETQIELAKSYANLTIKTGVFSLPKAISTKNDE